MSPVRLFAAVLMLIFVAEVAVMSVLPHLGLDSGAALLKALADAALLTAVLSPFLHFFVFKPLRSYFTTWEVIRKAQQASEQRFQDVAANAMEWVWEVDERGRYTYASPPVQQILGYEPQEILQKHFFDLFHPEERETLKADALRAFAAKESFRRFINRNVHRNGRTVWLSTSGVPMLDEDGKLLGYRGVDADITELKEMELRLKEAALTDELTGLLNRRGFQALAEFELTVAQRNGWGLTLLYTDVDNMKPINDQFGHATGDRALADLARVLKRTFRQSDIVGRLGGDEFGVLMMTLPEAALGNRIVHHLREELTRFNALGQRPYKLALSIGTSCCVPGKEYSLTDLVAEADRNMYQEKKSKPRAVPPRYGGLNDAA